MTASARDLHRAAEIVRRSARRFPNSGHELTENALAERLDALATRESKQESVTNGAYRVGISESVGKSDGKSVEAVLTRELERAEKEAAVWHEMEGGHQETNDANYYRSDGIAFGLRLALRVLNGGVV